LVLVDTLTTIQFQCGVIGSEKGSLFYRPKKTSILGRYHW